MAHAREEYLFQYTRYVLQSCTSRRLTYFLPPTNLIPLLFIRPLRLVLPSESVRRIRVMLLRAVSIPFVTLIWCYEGLRRILARDPQPPLARIRSRPLSTGKPSYGGLRPGELGMASALTRSTSPSKARGAGSGSMISASSIEGQPDLIVLVQKLSAQVDELTAMVAAQNNG